MDWHFHKYRHKKTRKIGSTVCKRNRHCRKNTVPAIKANSLSTNMRAGTANKDEQTLAQIQIKQTGTGT
jgi:hypothetical protein